MDKNKKLGLFALATVLMVGPVKRCTDPSMVISYQRNLMKETNEIVNSQEEYDYKKFVIDDSTIDLIPAFNSSLFVGVVDNIVIDTENVSSDQIKGLSDLYYIENIILSNNISDEAKEEYQQKYVDSLDDEDENKLIVDDENFIELDL